MKVIAKYHGGSHAYGLANEYSDLDERYLFLNTETSKILGLDRHEHQVSQNENEDSVGLELRHFLNLLRKGNTGALELLFNKNWLQKESEFQIIEDSRDKLVDSEKLFKCLCGYCHSERAFVLGERTGKLGGKRFEALQKYGYSYKNLVQFLRLCHVGIEFFQTGNFLVDTRSLHIYPTLFEIKNKPENCTVEAAKVLMDSSLSALHKAYDRRAINTKFDEDWANQICWELYLPILTNYNYPF